MWLPITQREKKERKKAHKTKHFNLLNCGMLATHFHQCYNCAVKFNQKYVNSNYSVLPLLKIIKLVKNIKYRKIGSFHTWAFLCID